MFPAVGTACTRALQTGARENSSVGKGGGHRIPPRLRSELQWTSAERESLYSLKDELLVD